MMFATWKQAQAFLAYIPIVFLLALWHKFYYFENKPLNRKKNHSLSRASAYSVSFINHCFLALLSAIIIGFPFMATGSAQAEVAQPPLQTPSQTTQAATTLESRVQAFWQARLVGDPVTSYGFEEVNATKELTLQQYVRKQGNIIYKQAKLLNIEIAGKDEAIARLMIEAVIPGLPSSLKSELKDYWVYIDGQWYHRVKNHRPGTKQQPISRF